MSTKSKRRAEKRRWAHLTIQEKAGEIAAKRPPRIVSGPASPFEVGWQVERDPTFGPDRRMLYRTSYFMPLGPGGHTARCVAFEVPTVGRFAGGRNLNPRTAMHREIVLVAERWRIEEKSEHAVTRVEWWNWRPKDHEARPAVHTARAILERASWMLDGVSRIDTRVRGEILHVVELLNTVRAAADEWLGEPDANAKPASYDRRDSRF